MNMNKSLIRLDWRTSCLLIFIAWSWQNCLGQIDTNFIDYLKDNRLDRELQAYFEQLDTLNVPKDTLSFYRGKYHLDNKDLFAFNQAYVQAKSLFSSDTIALIKASSLFVVQKKSIARRWFLSGSELKKCHTTNVIEKAYYISENPDSSNGSFLPASLQKTFLSHQKYNHRKPLVAGLLSALLPGAGKLYNGRKRGFWPAFLISAVQGIRAAESMHVYGIKNAYSILSLGMFSAFYFSNIYGSYHDLKQVKIEKRKAFLHEVSNYYYPTGL